MISNINNEVKARSLLDLDLLKDLSSSEMPTVTDLAATEIITTPSILPSFVRIAGDTEFLAEVDGSQLKGRVTNYLDRIRVRVGQFPWKQKRGTQLSQQECYTLLTSLPASEDQRRPESRIAQAVVKGYVDTRFTSVTPGDWRGALTFDKELLQSAIDPQLDLVSLERCFDLHVGKYKEVCGKLAFINKAILLGQIAVDPSDEQYLADGFAISSGLSAVAEALHLQADLLSVSEATKSYRFQMEAARNAIRNGADLRTKSGRGHYTRSLMLYAADPRLAVHYKGVNARQLVGQPIPPEIIESFQLTHSPHNLERNQKVIDFANNKTERTANFRAGRTTTLISLPKISLDESNNSNYPDNVISRNQPIFNKISGLLNLGDVREKMPEIIDLVVTDKGEGYSQVPFYCAGIQGHFVAQNLEGLTPDEQVRQITRIITDGNIVQKLNARYPDLNAIFPVGVIVPTSEGDLVILNKELAEKSQLESLLDLKVPADLRIQAAKIQADNVALRQDIPSRFSRRPTRNGDAYNLLNHEDLPGVIKKAVVKKAEKGVLTFELNFEGDNSILQNGQELASLGIINFADGKANIIWDQANQNIAGDLAIILESVVLRLIERSCCPPLNEVLDEVKKVETIGESDAPIPGYIGHVGGFRPSGERKQYTARAETKFAEAMMEMLGDMRALSDETEGISLAVINRRHLAQGMDPRYLTYYSGRESFEVGAPINRSAPEHLLPSLETETPVSG